MQKIGNRKHVPSLLNPHSPVRLDLLKDKSLPRLSFFLLKASSPKREWWVGEKLALISTKAVGLSSVGGNPKTMRDPASSQGVSKEDGWISFWSWCSRAKKRILRILFIWGNVWLMPIRISGSLSGQTHQLL